MLRDRRDGAMEHSAEGPGAARGEPTTASRAAPAVRVVVGAASLTNLGLAAGLVLDQGWARTVWPFETGRMSYLFVAGILAALAGASAWIAISGELDALPAGLLNLAVTLGGSGIHLLVTEDPHRTAGGVLVGLGVANAVGFLLVRRRLPVTGDRPPSLVRRSFLAFALVLFGVGVALLAGVDGVLPWPVDRGTEVLIGWIFVGDACFFGHGAARPGWANARAQLWAFLAYDVVVMPALVVRIPDTEPGARLSLAVYLAVLLWSALLAVRYLVLDPVTRGWGPGPPPHRTARPGTGARAGS